MNYKLNSISFFFRLLSVDVNILSNADCRAMNALYASRVADTMICAGVSGGGKVN